MSNNRILYIHRTQGQGAEGSHIRGMVDGFRELGWHVDLVGPPGVDPYRVCDIKDDKFSIVAKMLSWFAGHAPQFCFEIVELLYNVVALYRLEKQWRVGGEYTFIYERYSLNSFAGVVFALVKKVPLVLEVNDATVIERSRPLSMKTIAGFIESMVLHRAYIVVTITKQFKELLASHYGLAEDDFLVLPNAINPHKYDLEKSWYLYRAKMSIPEDSIVLGCVGAFVQWHGLEFLVETMGPYCETKNLYFLFIGDGPVREQVEGKAKELGIGHRLQFTGFVAPDIVPYYLDLVDICVIPGSNAHCSPMKLFEYMAAGKPVVLPRYKPLLDIISDGREGLFFTPHDSNNLVEILLKLILSKDLCKKIGQQGRELVLKRHTWNINASQVLKKIKVDTEKNYFEVSKE